MLRSSIQFMQQRSPYEISQHESALAATITDPTLFAGDWENPNSARHFECGKMIGTWSANFHQGQRSCAPQTGRTHERTRPPRRKRQETSCTAGAVHTWALLLRCGAMMQPPTGRSNRLICDGLRSCTTPHRQLSSRFRRVVRLPFDSGPPDQSRIDVMGHSGLAAVYRPVAQPWVSRYNS